MKNKEVINVIDTSSLIFDPEALTSFGKEDVCLALVTLTELDNFKKGGESRNFSARQVTRFLDEISVGNKNLIDTWVSLGPDLGSISIRYANGSLGDLDANKKFGEKTNDHEILNVCLLMKQENRGKVVLVSKDANLRVKARALGINAKDYEAGKVQIDQLYTGKNEILGVEDTAIDNLYTEKSISIDSLGVPYTGEANEYVTLKAKGSSKSAIGFFHKKNQTIELIQKDTMSISKIKPKNAEQAFALHALTNSEVKLVTLRGQAGTGKTLLAVAMALSEKQNFHQIYITRPIIPLSNRDIGYLPGDADAKTAPYMQPIFDQIKFIKSEYGSHDKQSTNIAQMEENGKLVVLPLAFIRGRTLTKACLIVDEAQNLTPHEAKTIISRAGEGTKIIFTGDIRQIDTPYLDSESNGLSYIISKVRDNDICAHIALEKGERSYLANLANELL